MNNNNNNKSNSQQIKIKIKMTKSTHANDYNSYSNESQWFCSIFRKSDKSAWVSRNRWTEVIDTRRSPAMRYTIIIRDNLQINRLIRGRKMKLKTQNTKYKWTIRHCLYSKSQSEWFAKYWFFFFILKTKAKREKKMQKIVVSECWCVFSRPADFNHGLMNDFHLVLLLMMMMMLLLLFVHNFEIGHVIRFFLQFLLLVHLWKYHVQNILSHTS